MENVIKELKGFVSGAVFTEERDLKRFARDQSVYYMPPGAVVVPADREDITKTLELAGDAGVPVTARGGGSGTAGAALGQGIVIAFHRKGPLNRILAFDDTGGSPEIRVEAGVMHSRVQAVLREKGLFLPADPSSGEISMMGGNIATKASGPHELHHGSIDRYLKHLCFIDESGQWVDTADESTIPTRIREGVSNLRQRIRADKKSMERLSGRAHRKIASGYNLFAMAGEGTRTLGELVAQLLVGSVGTLGVITGATLTAEPYIQGKITMAIPFRDLHEAGDAVHHIVETGAAAIEIISSNTLAMVRDRRRQAFEVLDFTGHLLLVELEGEPRHEQAAAIQRVLEQKGYHLEAPPQVASDEASQAKIWKDRKQLLPAIVNYKPGYKAFSLVNDIGVDVRFLADFILDIEAIFKKHGLAGAVYGHAGSGNLHLRPLFNLDRRDLKSFIRNVADEVYDAVFKYDGTITAEHGMGRLRAPYLEAEWGATMVGYMKELKRIFDPRGLLNPGVMFAEGPLTQFMPDFKT